MEREHLTEQSELGRITIAADAIAHHTEDEPTDSPAHEKDTRSVGAELVDRFGPLPEEVQHLLKIVAIKSLCRRANVERIETGPKGAVMSFRDNSFANPDGLVGYIREQGRDARVRPDMKVVFFDDWVQPEQRLKGTALILKRLVSIAERAKAA